MTDTENPAAHAKKVIGQILIGRCDGGLVEIAKACAVRTRDIGSAWQWRITLDGDTWDQDTVTTGELALAEDLAETSYINLDPKVRMRHRVALVIAHLHKAQGLTLPDAITRAEALIHAEQDDMIEMYEVAAPPKDEPSPTS